MLPNLLPSMMTSATSLGINFVIFDSRKIGKALGEDGIHSRINSIRHESSSLGRPLKHDARMAVQNCLVLSHSSDNEKKNNVDAHSMARVADCDETIKNAC